MRTVNIQQLLDNPDATGAVRLPYGEFEGPFYVNRPCVVVGSNTTLWAKDGPIITVNSRGAALKNLRVEITDSKTDRNISVAANFPDTRFSDVEIIGNVRGVQGEDLKWNIPKVVNLKKFPADRKNVFTMEVSVPVKTSIVCNIYDLKIVPSELAPGRNVITITTESLRSGSYIYGELLFVSAFTRRMYISGSADQNVTSFSDGETVFNASDAQNIQSEPAPVQSGRHSTVPVVTVQKSAIQTPVMRDGMVMIQRGQRITAADLFDQSDIEIELTYSDMQIQMEVDPYVFMLDENHMVETDDRLVFFGNNSSKCTGARFVSENGKNVVKLNLNAVAENVEKIAVSYSIYGDNPNHNFGKIINPEIIIKSDGTRKACFFPDGLLMETTIVALEFYRYKDHWKISAVGYGYRDGLKRLCESFGLNIIS